MALADVVNAASDNQDNSPKAARSVEPLFDQIGYRLDLMKDVAATKWQSNAAIEDLGREAVVIEKAAKDAALRAKLDKYANRR